MDVWIKEAGKITDGLYFLGTYQNCLYLLKGQDAIIIGGGMSWIAPRLQEQFAGIGLAPEKIKYLVILHSHFDHCGAVPYLKRKFPHIQILASAYAAKVLAKDKVVDSISLANKHMIDSLGLQREYDQLNLQFNGIKVDHVITEKDVIDLGDGIDIHFMEVPGHSQCSIAVYVPKLKALFPSDAAPLPVGGVAQLTSPSPQYKFSLYKESLTKLASCETDICAFEHYGVVTGNQSKMVLQNGLRETDNFEEFVVKLYRQLGDLDKTAEAVAVATSERNKFDFISSDIWSNVSRAEVRSVLRYAKVLD